jgi:hypothetical protein
MQGHPHVLWQVDQGKVEEAQLVLACCKAQRVHHLDLIVVQAKFKSIDVVAA